MKKFTIIIITFIITITLTGCGGYEELNNLSIVTAVAFDKTDDVYELSFFSIYLISFYRYNKIFDQIVF